MSSNIFLPFATPHYGGGGGALFAEALRRLIHDQFTIGAAFVQQFVDMMKINIFAVLGVLLATVGFTMLLPSLGVAVVNVVGFSGSGVVGGSLAALIRSSVYAGYITGIFSWFQSFGERAVLASPRTLTLGGALLVIGAGVFGYWSYRKMQRRFSVEKEAAVDGKRPLGDDDSDDDDGHHPKQNQPLIKR
ncbi:hypothetical protein M413DRAFT_13970 [Hebeloma cylindrosporum]|uniref:Uncharacterized protein n=1 Tax=Hebeloma cylindrosporum TaxID=76867 RepID=A0A0C3BID0_HEBCY|nr:hypothetical protein M413DRAFT_13970 [Hebeloma cylindrosporum h7]